MAQALGTREALIYKWKQQTKGEEKQFLVGHSMNVLLDSQHLQQRFQQLEVEREILKKALIIVSQQT